MHTQRSKETVVPVARGAVGMGLHEDRIGPPERREKGSRGNPLASGSSSVAPQRPHTDDEGEVAIRVVGHGFDREFAEFVARSAARQGLIGWIRIGSGEAIIRAVGLDENLASLVRELREHAPVDTSVRGFELERLDALPPLPSNGFIALLETIAPGEPAEAAGVQQAAGAGHEMLV